MITIMTIDPIDPHTLGQVKSWLTSNAKDYWSAADLAKAAAKEFDLFIGSDWTSYERDIPDEIVSAAEIAWHLWNDDDELQEADDHQMEDSRKLDRAAERLMDKVGLYATKTGYVDASQEDKDKLVKLAKEAIPKMEELIQRYLKSDFPDGTHHLESELKKLKAYASEETKDMKESSSDLETHLAGKKDGYTACGQHSDEGTLVQSVKDATCYYCKLAWEKGLAEMKIEEGKPIEVWTTNPGSNNGSYMMPDVEIKEDKPEYVYLPTRGFAGSLLVLDINDEPIGWIDTRTLGYENAKEWSKANKYIVPESKGKNMKKVIKESSANPIMDLMDDAWEMKTSFTTALKDFSAKAKANSKRLVTLDDKLKAQNYAKEALDAADMVRKEFFPTLRFNSSIESTQKTEGRNVMKKIIKEESDGTPNQNGKKLKELAGLYIADIEDSLKKIKFHLAKSDHYIGAYMPDVINLYNLIRSDAENAHRRLDRDFPGSDSLGESEYKEEPNQMNSSKEVVDEAYETDEDAKTELGLYMDNEYSIYNQKKSIIANLMRKMKSGKYDPTLAPKLWAYWVESGAKAYAKEFATPGEWSKMFPKPLRDELAAELAKDEEEKIKNGEYGSDPSKL